MRRQLDASEELRALGAFCDSGSHLELDVFTPLDEPELGDMLVRATMSFLADNGLHCDGRECVVSVHMHTTRMPAAIHVCARVPGGPSASLVIRDAVHGDVTFNRREYAILRTKSMQRLHHVRQLGTAYHVYPGAMHTRFEHSIGTFHMSKRFIAELEARGHALPVRTKEAIRAAALLHDIAHRPFGHTLEDEGRVVLKDHDDRALEVIESDSELVEALGDLLEPVKAILIAKEVHFPRFHTINADKRETKRDKELWKQAESTWPDVEPFMGQIVGDTICADLCDYLLRDVLYTGLHRDYDDRIFKYLTLTPLKLVNRVQRFLAFRIADTKALSPDAVSEIVHLLNTRHAIGARVYFHHHKMALGGMVCKAVRMLQADDQFDESILDTVGDEGFLLYLAGRIGGRRRRSSGPAALAQAVIEREHYRRAYVLSGETQKTEAEKRRVIEIRERYRNDPNAATNLLEIEAKIAKKLRLKPHEVVVTCTDPKMQLKEAEVYVIDSKGEAIVLADHADELAPELSSILDNHRRLWRLYVFIKAPSDDSPILGEADKYCRTEEVFGIDNNLMSHKA